jgi:orotidine-5'-phosphate decarboxylase
MSPRYQVTKSPELIVALDVDTLKKAEDFVNILSPAVKHFKIGSQLFTAYGPDAVKMVTEKGGRVFLDLKFHDIPNTVFSAVASGTSLSAMPTPSSNSFSNTELKVTDATQLKVFMMTVHIKGGIEMLREAARGAAEKAKELDIAKPFIVGVTRLTSDKDNKNIKEEVIKAARLAKDSGLDGVVCSPHEAKAVRKEFGKDFIIVTPGIRLKNSPLDDQKRTATAAQALAAGADYIVVGRPILEASDPLRVAKDIIAELTST